MFCACIECHFILVSFKWLHKLYALIPRIIFLYNAQDISLPVSSSPSKDPVIWNGWLGCGTCTSLFKQKSTDTVPPQNVKHVRQLKTFIINKILNYSFNIRAFQYTMNKILCHKNDSCFHELNIPWIIKGIPLGLYWKCAILGTFSTFYTNYNYYDTK